MSLGMSPFSRLRFCQFILTDCVRISGPCVLTHMLSCTQNRWRWRSSHRYFHLLLKEDITNARYFEPANSHSKSSPYSEPEFLLKMQPYPWPLGITSHLLTSFRHRFWFPTNATRKARSLRVSTAARMASGLLSDPLFDQPQEPLPVEVTLVREDRPFAKVVNRKKQEWRVLYYCHSECPQESGMALCLEDKYSTLVQCFFLSPSYIFNFLM